MARLHYGKHEHSNGDEHDHDDDDDEGQDHCDGDDDDCYYLRCYHHKECRQSYRKNTAPKLSQTTADMHTTTSPWRDLA